MKQPFSVRECLHGYANETLGAMCEHWKLAANSKLSRLKALERVLNDPLHLKSAVASLDSVSLRMLHVLGTRGAVSTADLLSVPGLYDTHQPDQSVQKLAVSGLALVCPDDRNGVFSVGMLSRERLNGHGGPNLFVPGAVRALAPESPRLETTLPSSSEASPVVDPPAPHRLTQAMLEVFRIIDLIEPRIAASGEIHRNDEVRIEELRRDSGVSKESLGLALMMARQLGCVVTEHRKLVTAPPAEQWTAQSHANRMRDLFLAYVSSPCLTDLRLFFPDIAPQIEEHLPQGSMRRTYHRQLAVKILRESAADTWYAVGALADIVRQADSNVLFLLERWRSILSHAQDSGPSWQERAWQAHEKRLYIWLVQAVLADMGVVELGGQGQFMRITPIGRFALGLGPEPDPSEQASAPCVTVQPDFEVIVYLDRCSPVLQRKLDRFCERRRASAVSTYVLTEQSVYRGARAGISPTETLRTLSESANHPVPDNVREQLSAWRRKMEAITVRRKCVVLEFATEAERTLALTQHPDAHPIGERFLRVAQPSHHAVPHIDYSITGRPALLQESGLQFRLPWASLDLFGRKRLGEIGELREGEAGDLLLRLVRSKSGRPEDWNLVVAQLESLTAEPLKARYRLALRAWSGDVGPVTAGPVTLLRFDDPDICEAVLDFPEIADLVEGRAGLHAIIVRKGQLSNVKKALRVHGISVQSGSTFADTQPPEVWAREWVEQHAPGAALQETAAPTKSGATQAPRHEALPVYSPRITGELLSDAIARRKPVLIEYRSAWTDLPSLRRVDPVTLDLNAASPFLSGICHTAHSARTFQLARVLGIRVLEDESF